MHDARNCPDEIIESLRLYVERGVPVGGFLEAVLANDLQEAVARADMNNTRRLGDIVAFVYYHVPIGCYGSRDLIRDYIQHVRETGEGARLIQVDGFPAQADNPKPDQ